MNQSINKRIESLRELLCNENLQAFIVPSTDPHLSEYVALHWKSREWISGFNGSAGTVVITANEAGLWTDSRYFLQGAQQLEGTGISLYKEMLSETPSITDFIVAQLQPGDVVGIDGQMFAAEAVETMKAQLETKHISIRSIADPMDQIWADRPPMPQDPAFIYELKYAGKSCQDKLSIIRQEMKKRGAASLLLSALDEVAWALNLRGSDVHCNPVIVSYLLIEEHNASLFIDSCKITPEVSIYLKELGITLYSYKEICTIIAQLTTTSMWIDPAKTNFAVYSAISAGCRIINDASPVSLLKAIRNEQEITCVREAMRKDGVAMTKFLKWLEEAVPSGKETEISIDHQLHNFRAQQADYMGESFDTIAGYKEHAAIVHYSATPDSASTLLPKGFLLLDSGAQYLDGTTDITRTIALGQLSEEEKIDYTLVLRGHIALAMAHFPVGTRGAQLDVLARMPMWQQGMNYLHGTGHGIGHFLGVHEGPQSIRMNENPVVLQPGMVTSNEPGIYKAGRHGIRTENIHLVVPAGEGMFGSYLKFETLTLCPICKKGIIKEMLTAEELTWLNHYHQTVYEKLSPSLNAEEQEWLKAATDKL